LSVRDGRRPPFVWVTVASLAHLRIEWDAKRAEVRKGVGLAVYHALCEMANSDRVRGPIGDDSGRFRTSKSSIGELAGISSRSVERACNELARIDMLMIESDRQGENRPGRPSYYTLLEPGQTSANTSDPADIEGTTEVRTPSDKASDPSSKRPPAERTPPSKEKKKQQKKEESAPPTEPDFSILPATVSAPLRQASDAKGGVLDPQGVKRAMDTFPNVDHAEEAEKFAYWHLHGNGKKAPLKGVSQAFRSWLKKAPEAEAGKVTKLPVAPPVDLEKLAEGLPDAERAWTEALPTLERSVPGSTFRLWVEPLSAAGAEGDTLYLTGPDGQRAWTEKRYSGLIREALADCKSPLRRVAFIPPASTAEAAA
jgi:hypothetical protein